MSAILFPVFAQAREKARAAACLSNCKQLGTAVQMYAQDYDGAYPLSWYGMAEGFGFDAVLFPYIKNYQVYDCPSNHVTPRYWEGYPTRGVGPIPGSYAMNGDLVARGPGGVGFGGREGRTGLTEAAVVAPADTILITEIWDTRGPNGAKTFHMVNGVRFAGGPHHEIFATEKNDVCWGIPFNIHYRGSDYVFCDGHARWERVEATWNQWHADGSVVPGRPTLCDQRRGK